VQPNDYQITFGFIVLELYWYSHYYCMFHIIITYNYAYYLTCPTSCIMIYGCEVNEMK
jgi:hypothetical protein